MNNEQYKKSLKLCSKEQHKIRENSFGVIWCVRCGKLFSNNTKAKPLLEEDIITIKN